MPVAPDRGQEEDVAEDQREEGGGEEQGAEVAEREGAMGEERRLDDRAGMAQAAGDDGAEQERGRRRRRPASPAPVQPQSLPSTIPSVTAARPSASISAPGRSGSRLSRAA